MKSRVSRLVDLRKGLEYQFESDTSSASEDPMDIVASNCSFTVSAIEMEMCAVRALRPDVKRPFLHVSLSCPPGERLTRKTWAGVIRFVLNDVGLDTRRHQYAARRHARKKLDHCHVIVNRVAFDAHLEWPVRGVEVHHGVSARSALSDVVIALALVSWRSVCQVRLQVHSEP